MTASMSYKNTMLNTLLSFIYDKAQEKLTQQLDSILVSYSMAEGDGDMGFLYKGESYLPVSRVRLKKRIRLLPKRLHSFMDEYLSESKELAAEKEVIKSFLITAIVKAKTPEELKAYLPDCLKNAFPHVTESSEVTKDFVTLFHVTHDKNIQIIKQRLVLNLIT